MDTNGFRTCADCINKRFLCFDKDGRKKYYCKLVDGIVRGGIVFDTTDASACIKWGLYNQRNK